MAAQALVSRTLGRDDRAFHATPAAGGFSFNNMRQGLTAQFGRNGVLVRAGDGRLGLALTSYGHGGRLIPLASALPRAGANHVNYGRGTVSEWYANGPLGLEQGFTLRTPPAGQGTGPLTLALKLSGNLQPSLAGGSDLWLRSSGGAPALRYSGLSASDASGRSLRAWLELNGREVLLHVADAGARYPLVVDPMIQQTAKLTASDGAAGDGLGQSVSVSADTVVAGAPGATVGVNAGQGAAYVFEKPDGGSWANATEAAKLTVSNGAAGDALGGSVSISGATVVAGVSGANAGQGAAYVFVAPDDDSWETTTETAKLTASLGAAGDGLGTGVSVSGNTVVAGAPGATVGVNAGQGAAYVFVAPSSGWTSATETAKLTASALNGAAGDGLGSAVSVSGSTVVAGAPSDTTGNNGAAYVFVKPSSGWKSINPITETAMLTASDGVTGDGLGSAVSVSGSTVVAGAPFAAGPAPAFNAGQGAAYVFVKPSSGWTSATETAKLTASDGTVADGLGSSVAALPYAVLAGAPTAKVGSNSDQGAVYLFARPRNGWQKTGQTETAKLTASDGAAEDQLGSGVSASGLTAVAGAPSVPTGGHPGAVYVFGK
jgi:hypothetical protein